MIGRELIEQLLKRECKLIIATDVKAEGYHLFDMKKVIFTQEDLVQYERANNLFMRNGPVDYVFHLAGIKGNPKKTKERPVDDIQNDC